MIALLIFAVIYYIYLLFFSSSALIGGIRIIIDKIRSRSKSKMKI